MEWLPPLPEWDAMHPVLVHLPLGVLTVVPVFLAIAAFTFPRWKCFAAAALLLMALGSAGAIVAVASGEAAIEYADRTDITAPVLEEHEDLAEWTRTYFVALTLVYGVLLGVVSAVRPLAKRGVGIALHAAVLALSLVGVLLLVNTGHLGGRLVHQYGIRAMIGPAPSAPTQAESAPPAETAPPTETK